MVSVIRHHIEGRVLGSNPGTAGSGIDGIISNHLSWHRRAGWDNKTNRPFVHYSKIGVRSASAKKPINTKSSQPRDRIKAPECPVTAILSVV